MENHINIDIKNRELFKKKDLLRKIYTDYFIKVKQNLNISSTKPSLEIGSSGFIKSVIIFFLELRHSEEELSKLAMALVKHFQQDPKTKSHPSPIHNMPILILTKFLMLKKSKTVISKS